MNAHDAERRRNVWIDTGSNSGHKDSGQTEPSHALRFAQKLHETSEHEEANPTRPQCHRRTTNRVFSHGRNTSALSSELLFGGDGRAPIPEHPEYRSIESCEDALGDDMAVVVGHPLTIGFNRLIRR